jgi:hypothetical protein
MRVNSENEISTTMEFDRFADDYAHILDHTVSASGEDSSYFAEYR